MTQINIPSITLDTPIPFNLNLRERGQPLEGLRTREHWVRLMRVHIVENHRFQNWHGSVPEVVGYTVTTVGLTPQTKRQKVFGLSERAEMVRFVNEWIAKTVAAGLKKIAEQQVEKEMRANNHRDWIAGQIEKAGGVEERRQQIVRDGYAIAAKEAFQFEGNDVYAAIMVSLTHHTPIVLDEETRAKIVEKYERYVKESWSVRNYIAARMQELDEFLGKTQQEVA